MQRARPRRGRHRGDEQQPVQRPLRPLGRWRGLSSGQDDDAHVVLLAFQQQRRDWFTGEGLADFAKHLVGLASEVALELNHVAERFAARDDQPGGELGFQSATAFRSGWQAVLAIAAALARAAASPGAHGVGRHKHQHQNHPKKQCVHVKSFIGIHPCRQVLRGVLSWSSYCSLLISPLAKRSRRISSADFFDDGQDCRARKKMTATTPTRMAPQTRQVHPIPHPVQRIMVKFLRCRRSLPQARRAPPPTVPCRSSGSSPS